MGWFGLAITSASSPSTASSSSSVATAAAPGASAAAAARMPGSGSKSARTSAPRQKRDVADMLLPHHAAAETP
jgi:hypothetical protein